MGTRCCEVLEQELSGLRDKRILVIGNGQMGRLAAALLQQSGAQVFVTLRTYRHGETVVPAGCCTVPYDERVAALEGMDALVSATTSPHYTITLEQLMTLQPYQPFFAARERGRDDLDQTAELPQRCNTSGRNFAAADQNHSPVCEINKQREARRMHGLTSLPLTVFFQFFISNGLHLRKCIRVAHSTAPQ